MNNSRLSNLTRHVRRCRASWIVPSLLLLTPLAVVQAQFTYRTNNGTITITGYDGPDGPVTIPSMVGGLPVTTIGQEAFFRRGVTSVTIPNSVTTIGDWAFSWCYGLTGVTIPGSVTNIGGGPFARCTSLAAITVDALNPAYISVDGALLNTSQTALLQYPPGRRGAYTLPRSVTSIGDGAFDGSFSLTNFPIGNGVISIGAAAFRECSSLVSVTISDTVKGMGPEAFFDCSSLTSITIGNGVTNIGYQTFWACANLTNVTIGNSVTSIGTEAFRVCFSLAGVYFTGNAPRIDGFAPFDTEGHATVYYLSGTTGWGSTFGGRPTALWLPPPSPQTQTAGVGSAVEFRAWAGGNPGLGYRWFFNGTNRLSCTNRVLRLADVQSAQAGAYTVVMTNAAGSVTSPPAFLNVIPPVERRMVPGLTLMGQPGTSLNLDFSAALGPVAHWTTFDNVLLTAASQWYFDLAAPLPPQGFYRAWQSSGGAPPALKLDFVPALTLTGSIGSSVRLDYINQFGPIDAWVNLATVTLTNTSQLYFDTAAIGQPPRLWRIVPVP